MIKEKDNMNKKIKVMALAGVIASIYAVLCYAFGGLAYMGVQLRLATLIEPLPFYLCSNKEIRNATKVGVILGCILSNMFSPIGLIDVCFGVVEEMLVLYVFYGVCLGSRIKQTISFTLVNGIFVALELFLVFKISFVYSFITVGASCFILYFLGTFVCERIAKEKSLN